MAGSALVLMLLTAAGVPTPTGTAPAAELFAPSTRCVACHTGGPSTATDVPIASGWRASMMANAARDPYWQAAVRRETQDHPAAAAAIEHECSACHMPSVRFAAHAAGRRTSVFAHASGAASPADLALAMDGVTCSVCHQITAQKLGEPESFNAGFAIDPTRRRAGGPFTIDPGRTRVMSSASGFTPAEATHLQDSAVCATCHTLYTHALTKDGAEAGRLPEQVPFLEWRHSAWRGQRSCQSCHMPEVPGEVAITAVLPQPRPRVSEHDFRGGNAFMMRILRTNAAALGVTAQESDLLASEERAIEHLRSHAARVAVENLAVDAGRVTFEVAVTNLAGHKLPTAYPSRRVWLHVVVRDGAGGVVFESGAVRPDGSIAGNDNDVDPARFEPHYTSIERAEQVQIYEAILGDPAGGVTTGLITAVRYLKDNRILPLGFDKAMAEADIGVYGEAADDPDFRDASDRIRYLVDAAGREGPFTVDVELLYQSIGFRWAESLRESDTRESGRFHAMYSAAAPHSALRLAAASTGEPAGR